MSVGHTIVPHDGVFHCTFAGASGCTHDELFGATYQRANRLNSTKILRCFPHCCPGHVRRSYCGAALSVCVMRTSSASSLSSSEVARATARDVPLHGELFVFARFRVSEDARADRLTVGTELCMDTIACALQSPSHTQGEWIASRRVQQSDRATPGTWRFELNASRRWYYAWRSDKTNSQRYMTHALEAVVVLVDDQQIDTRIGVVVAHTTSPPFTITSFRRCGTDEGLCPSQRPLTALEASLLARVAGQQEEPTRSRARAVEPIRITHHDTKRVAFTPIHRRDERSAVTLDRPHHPAHEDANARSSIEHTTFSATLGILFTALEHVPLAAFVSLAPYWNERRAAPPRL